MNNNLNKLIRRFLFLFALVLGMSVSVKAYAVTTPYATLSKETNLPSYIVRVNGDKNRIYTYRIFSQDPLIWGKTNYITTHGCAVCSLTTVLSGRSAKYRAYTPDMTYKTLEKKVFGKKTWNRNYKKRINSQMPVSLYGISRILKYAGIKNTYVRKFKNGSAVKAIEKHLRKGKPVIIEVNNHTQKNGRFSSSPNQKWARTKHTMVLLGMTDNGKVIVADSATRKWAGQSQRLKYTTMSELVRFMIPCKQNSNSCYYSSLSSSGGYILVK